MLLDSVPQLVEALQQILRCRLGRVGRLAQCAATFLHSRTSFREKIAPRPLDETFLAGSETDLLSEIESA